MTGINNNVSARQLGTKLNIEQQRTRQTSKTDFGTKLKAGLAKTADVAMAAGSIAAPFLPGGQVVSAAISGIGQLKDAAGGASSGLGSASGAMGSNAMMIGGGSTGGSTSISGASGNSAFAAVDKMAAGGDSQAQMFNATKELQSMNQSFNLQYLQLQQDMQSQNRQFTTVSNIMKVKHDTAKSAINNIR